MFISRVKMSNIGQHRSFEAKLKPGLVGIVGRNGSGKSTVLNGMYFALTGDFRRLGTTKADCVNIQRQKGESSLVELEVQKGDHALRIVRRMEGKPAVSVSMAGMETIDHTEKANEFIYSFLGLNQRMLDTFVFKKQDSIYDFLSATDSERKAAFHTLCGTQICEQIWDTAGAILTEDDLRLFDIDTKQFWNDKYVESTKDLDVVKNDISNIKEKLDTQFLAKAKHVITQATRRADLKTKLQELVDKSECVRKEMEQAREELELLTQELAAFGLTDAESLKSVVGRNQQYLKDSAKFEELLLRHSKFSFDLLSYEDEAAELVSSGNYAEALRVVQVIANELVTRKRKVDDEVQTVKAAVKHYASLVSLVEGGVVVCPTCKANIDPSSPAYAEHLDDAKNSAQLLDDLEKTQKKLDMKIQAAAVREKMLAELVEIATQIEKLAYVSSFEAFDATEVIEKYHRKIALETTYEKLTKEHAVLKGQIRKLKKELKTIPKSLKKEKQEAKRAIKDATVASASMARLSERLSTLKKTVVESQNELAKIAKKEYSNHRKLEFTKLVLKVRDVFHRDGLPSKVSQRNMDAIIRKTNKILKEFGDPFWVSPAEDLQFNVHRVGEPMQLASRLSVGQKVVLSVSFWFAISSLWCNDVGILALDEPTAALDEANRQYLSRAFAAMRGKVGSIRQLFIVTHADNLVNQFDQVLRLE